MGVSYYECHVTMMGDKDALKAETERLNWKFSVIDGDPVLGDGIKCYATKLFNRNIPVESVQGALFSTAHYLAQKGTVLRRKVEHVIFDDRSSKVNCEGGCVECHLDDL